MDLIHSRWSILIWLYCFSEFVQLEKLIKSNFFIGEVQRYFSNILFQFEEGMIIVLITSYFLESISRMFNNVRLSKCVLSRVVVPWSQTLLIGVFSFKDVTYVLHCSRFDTLNVLAARARASNQASLSAFVQVLLYFRYSLSHSLHTLWQSNIIFCTFSIKNASI